MIPFSEDLRYKYDLTSTSMCVDVGGYEGNWAKIIHGTCGCRVDVYEPVKRFYDNIVERLKGIPMIRIYNFGVAGQRGEQEIHVQNDSSGAFAGSTDVEVCKMKGIADLLKISNVAVVDVLKLNCEGAEYDIMDAMLVGKDAIGPFVKRFRNIQVQFHAVVPDFQKRYDAIAGDLSQTHELTWRHPFLWENWRLKQPEPVRNTTHSAAIESPPATE